jgi:hypothetical protein
VHQRPGFVLRLIGLTIDHYRAGVEDRASRTSVGMQTTTDAAVLRRLLRLLIHWTWAIIPAMSANELVTGKNEPNRKVWSDKVDDKITYQHLTGRQLTDSVALNTEHHTPPIL